MAGNEQGRRLLKNLAQAVRERVTAAGAPLIEQRGLEAVEELARELTAPDGIPGLKLWRDTPAKFRLQRDRRNAEITIEFQRDIGAVVLTAERVGQRRKQLRFVYEEPQNAWRAMEGEPELFEGVTATLVEFLYPEGSR